jgi:kynurenine formamidase
MSDRWIDLSYPLSVSTPPFPGDPPVEIEVLDSTDACDDSLRKNLNCSRISLCIHCGTHMDSPFHFFANGLKMDEVSLEACCGDALLLHLEDRLGRNANAIIDEDLLSDCAGGASLPARVVLRTDWFRQWGTPHYFREHPLMTRGAARFLVDRGVRLVGVDFPSVDQSPFEAHLELLGNNVLIVENLTNLDQLPCDDFELVATPLAIVGRDGSPVRAVARIEENR